MKMGGFPYVFATIMPVCMSLVASTDVLTMEWTGLEPTPTCVYNCYTYSEYQDLSTSTFSDDPQPQGPTKEEIEREERQKQVRDLDQMADQAVDKKNWERAAQYMLESYRLSRTIPLPAMEQQEYFKQYEYFSAKHKKKEGIEAAAAGKWKDALEKLKQASRDLPDDKTIQKKLREAELIVNLRADVAELSSKIEAPPPASVARLKLATFGELMAAKEYGKEADKMAADRKPEVAKALSNMVFDTPGKYKGSVSVAFPKLSKPVVSPDQRTPRVVEIEARIKDLEEIWQTAQKKLKVLEQQPDTPQQRVEVVKQRMVSDKIEQEKQFEIHVLIIEIESPSTTSNAPVVPMNR